MGCQQDDEEVAGFPEIPDSLAGRQTLKLYHLQEWPFAKRVVGADTG